jgi:hypothetical protein
MQLIVLHYLHVCIVCVDHHETQQHEEKHSAMGKYWTAAEEDRTFAQVSSSRRDDDVDGSKVQRFGMLRSADSYQGSEEVQSSQIYHVVSAALSD